MAISLRNRINDHCRQCIYDPCSPGSWRQQVTLCSVKSCPLYDVRPKSTSTIPESVLVWYGVDSGSFYGPGSKSKATSHEKELTITKNQCPSFRA